MQATTYFRNLTFVAVFLCRFFGASLVSAEQFDDLLGFKIGGTSRETLEHASANGWELKQLSAELPHEWIVEGTSMSICICADKIGAIRKRRVGGLDEFASIVSELRAKYGTPRTTIGTFMAGRTRISNIRADFSGPEALNVSVGLSSTDGNIGVHMNFFYKDSCPEVAASP